MASHIADRFEVIHLAARQCISVANDSEEMETKRRGLEILYKKLKVRHTNC